MDAAESLHGIVTFLQTNASNSMEFSCEGCILASRRVQISGFIGLVFRRGIRDDGQGAPGVYLFAGGALRRLIGLSYDHLSGRVQEHSRGLILGLVFRRRR